MVALPPPSVKLAYRAKMSAICRRFGFAQWLLRTVIINRYGTFAITVTERWGGRYGKDNTTAAKSTWTGKRLDLRPAIGSSLAFEHFKIIRSEFGGLGFESAVTLEKVFAKRGQCGSAASGTTCGALDDRR